MCFGPACVGSIMAHAGSLCSPLNSNMRFGEFSLHSGRTGDMLLVTIFCLGKIDRSSNKDGSDYRP